MPRPARIDREQLLDASLALLDEHGADGLSMRSLADRLQVKPASLYNHINGREQLNQLIADTLWTQTVADLTEADWRTVLTDLATRIRSGLREHPGAAQIVAVTNVSAAAYEPMIPLITRAFAPLGIDVQDALLVASSLGVLVIGLALAEFGDAPRPPVAPREYYDRWFDLAVGTFLAGISARFAQEA
jgi:AcrR family transcriptional regulator